jgi:hypothetical protein
MMSDEDDFDCPLCMEELDISDRNFRPCPCGYQVTKRQRTLKWSKVLERENVDELTKKIFCHFLPPKHDIDLPLLLAPHQRRLEWSLPSLSSSVLGRDCGIHPHFRRRVSVSQTLCCALLSSIQAVSADKRRLYS